MKKLIIILILLIPFIAGAQYTNTVYIDPPLGQGLKDGTSPSNAFTSWTDVGLQLSSNTSYRQKRGTVDSAAYINYMTGVTNVRIGAYGAGTTLPITVGNVDLYGSIYLGHPDGRFGIRYNGATPTTDIVIDSINIKGVKLTDSLLQFAIKVQSVASTVADPIKNLTFTNLEISNTGTGIIFNDSDNYIDSVTIDNCHLHDIAAEGIFGVIQGTISNNVIERFNQAWHLAGHTHEQSGGDGIQLGIGNVEGGWLDIFGNTINKSDVGNKFCFIFNSNGDDGGWTIRLYDNIFYPPKDTLDDEGGAALYIPDRHAANLYMYRNKFIGRGYSQSVEKACEIGEIEVGNLLYMAFNTTDSMSGISLTGSQRGRQIHFMNNTVVGVPAGASLINNSSGDTVRMQGNINLLHTSALLVSGGDAAKIDSSRNITAEGDSMTWDSRTGITDWEAADFTLSAASGIPAIDFTIYNDTVMSISPYDGDSTEIPQVDGNTVSGQVMDAGAYNYDDGFNPLFKPVITIVSSADTVEVNDTVRFDGNSTRSPTSYAWIIGDSTYITNGATDEEFITFMNYFTGTRIITHRATNADGTSSLNDSVVIITSTKVIADFEADDYNPSLNDTVNFTDLSTGSPDRWVWQFTGGTYSYLEGTTYASQHPIVKFLEAKTYVAYLTVYKDNNIDTHIRTLDGDIECPECPPVNPPDTVINNYFYKF